MTVLVNYRTYDGGRQILDMHKDSEAAYPSYIGLYEHTAEYITVLFRVALYFLLKIAYLISYESHIKKIEAVLQIIFNDF